MYEEVEPEMSTCTLVFHHDTKSSSSPTSAPTALELSELDI